MKDKIIQIGKELGWEVTASDVEAILDCNGWFLLIVSANGYNLKKTLTPIFKNYFGGQENA